MSTDQAPSEGRAFVYSLEPYARQQQWRLEQIQTKLAQTRHAELLAEQQHRYQDEALAAQAQHLSVARQRRFDPGSDANGLSHLVQLQRRLAHQQEHLCRLREQCRALQAQCLELQRKLDALNEHRAGQLRAHQAELARLAAVEADRDWLARQSTATSVMLERREGRHAQ